MAGASADRVGAGLAEAATGMSASGRKLEFVVQAEAFETEDAYVQQARLPAASGEMPTAASGVRLTRPQPNIQYGTRPARAEAGCTLGKETNAMRRTIANITMTGMLAAAGSSAPAFAKTCWSRSYEAQSTLKRTRTGARTASIFAWRFVVGARVGNR